MPTHETMPLVESAPQRVPVTDAQVDGIYAFGHRFFVQRQYGRALDFMLVALQCRPQNPDYLVAVGLSYRMLEQHEAALRYFLLAQCLDPMRMDPLVHMADCALQLGHADRARLAAEAALACPRDGTPKEAQLLCRAEVLRHRALQMAAGSPSKVLQ